MRRPHLVTLAASLLLTGCPEAPPPAPPARPVIVEPATVLPEPRPDGRLPPLATPTHYRVDLDIDPAQPRFRGTVTIDVEIPQKTSFVVVHGSNIDVASAHAELSATEHVLARASTRTAGSKSPDELVLAFAKPLPPGHATVVVAYSAPFGNELSGLYRVRDGERWYAFTQFESMDARRAFPCFDEPAFKVPFDVSITVPRPMIAVANAAETSREQLREQTRFRFAQTRPLPTYLVAFAVGDLEIETAARASTPPIRIITTKGKTGLNALALEATGGIVDALQNWFGMPYPYDKLDIVAVPEFGPGAMENPGLVTFREERLLLDPARASVTSRRSQALIIAHELAHQWFGDLVTASWWNDIWLNEGMATWMETRVVDAWRPELGTRVDALVSAHSVMDLDGLASARAVRQPVRTTSDAKEAFDSITYAKGAAVLSTIERWVGEDAFQRGVRAYLSENAYKSVQADRLLSALDAASGKNVTQMASSYLDTPGVPEVSARFECEAGARWHVELSPQPWRPLGSKLPEQSDRAWTIPVCVKAQGEKAPACTELVAGAPSLIAGKGRCPTFVHPNAQSTYYRFTSTERDFVRLAEARKELDVPARVSVLANAWAAVRSGQLESKALLKILPAFDDDNSRQVVDGVVGILYGMNDYLVDEDDRPAFRTFARARLAKRKKALGWTPTAQANSAGDESLMRSSVLYAMGDVVQDDATLREAEELATRWLADPASVDPDAGAVALDLASRRADASRAPALLAAMKNAKTRQDRHVALRAMMGFDGEMELQRALELTLGDDIRPNEMRYVIGPVFARRTARPIAEAWVRSHWDALTKKLPGGMSIALVRAAGAGCSSDDADDRAAFYDPRFANVEGSRRRLAEAYEAVSLCAALREKGAPSLRKALLDTKKK